LHADAESISASPIQAKRGLGRVALAAERGTSGTMAIDAPAKPNRSQKEAPL
jgi:hypothetical protein